MTEPPAVLVVGGSRVLRTAAAALARSAEVTVATRGPAPLPPGVHRLVLDTGDASTAVPGVWDGALVYAPAAAPLVLERVARATRGPLVLLVTSAALAQGTGAARGIARSRAIPVLLGWTGPEDRPRWHTPEEIGDAALAALRTGAPQRLGRLLGRGPG